MLEFQGQFIQFLRDVKARVVNTAYSTDKDTITVVLKVNVKDEKELNHLIRQIEKRSDVLEAYRVST